MVGNSRGESPLTLVCVTNYHQPFRDQLLGGAGFDPSNGGRLIVANPEIARRSNTPLAMCCPDPQVVEADKMDFGLASE